MARTIHRPTTRDAIDNLTFAPGRSPSIGDLMKSDGFNDVGDGGKGTWEHLGVTGQTPSQDPGQLVDGLFNDPSGFQWALVVKGYIYWLSLGVVNDENIDSFTSMQAALNYAASLGGVRIIAQAGDYASSDTLVFPAVNGLVIEGTGASRASNSDYPVVIHSTHASGVGIKFTGNGQGLIGVVQRASGARATAPLDSTSFGVLFEPEDTPDTALSMCFLTNFLAQGNPSHGIVSSGPNFMFDFNGIATRGNKGHGTWISAGTVTGRTNLGRPGGFIIKHHRTFGDGGHAILAGADIEFGMFRLSINDADYDPDNDIEASIALGQYTAVLHGENICTENVAYGGRVDGTPTLIGLRVSGRVHRHTTPRFVAVSQPVHAFQDLGVGFIKTEDITFDGFFLTNASTGNPAIQVDDDIGTITVISPYDEFITDFFTTGYTNGVLLKQNLFEMLSKTIEAFNLKIIGATTTGIEISRDNSESGLEVVRTGTGAATLRLDTNAGVGNLSTTTDTDLLLKRNSVERMRLNNEALNLITQTFADDTAAGVGGLSAGDIYKTATGELRIKT